MAPRAPRAAVDVAFAVAASTRPRRAGLARMLATTTPQAHDNGYPDFTPLRLGLLGLSPHSRTLVDAARQSQRCAIVAAAVRDEKRLAAWGEEEDLVGVRFYESYNELLRDDNVDAVYIGLPTAQHMVWCCAAAKMHKHVLVEKPLAGELSDALAMRRACAEEDVVLMDSTMFPYHERTEQILTEIRNPRDFGEVRRVTAAFSFGATEQFLRGSESARAAEDDPLGCLGDLGWYCARAGLLAFGPDANPKSCQATVTDSNAQGVPLDVAGVCYFDDERKKVLSFHCSFLHPLRQWLEVVGDHKVLTCDDFVIPRFAKDCAYTVESFPWNSSPLVDLHSCVVAVKNETRVLNAHAQRVRLLDTFADLCLELFDGRDAARKTAMDDAVLTQALVSCLVESCRQNGALLSMGDTSPLDSDADPPPLFVDAAERPAPPPPPPDDPPKAKKPKAAGKKRKLSGDAAK